MHQGLRPKKYLALMVMDLLVMSMVVFLLVPMEWSLSVAYLTQKIVLQRFFVLAFFLGASCLLFHLFGAYRPSYVYRLTRLAALSSIGIGALCTAMLWFCLQFPMRLYLRPPIAFFFFSFVSFYILFSRKLSLASETQPQGMMRILFAGTDAPVLEVVHFLQNQREKKYEIMGMLSDLPVPPACPVRTADSSGRQTGQSLGIDTVSNLSACEHAQADVPVFHFKDNIDALIKNADIFVFSLNFPSTETLIKKIQSLRFDMEDRFALYNLPTFYKIIAEKIPVFTGNEPWLSVLKELITTEKEVELALKRIMDILLASMGILILFPLLLFVALLIKLTSKGPIFFRQERIGLNGEPFEMLKFRTMVAGAEVMKGLDAVTLADDERITRFGRWLRVSHMDELPQLVNVCKGEMSLIGPRPLNKHLEEKFMNDIPGYTLRYLMKPGLSGWAQVNHYDSRSYEGQLQRFQYDLYYIRHFSLFIDVVIYLRTIKVLLLARGVR